MSAFLIGTFFDAILYGQEAGGEADAIAIGQWSGEGFFSSAYGIIFLILMLILAALVLLNRLSRNHTLLGEIEGVRAENLFLGVKFDSKHRDLSDVSQKKFKRKGAVVAGKKIGPVSSSGSSHILEKPSVLEDGYLRSLDLHQASFVSPKLLIKNDLVTFYLNSLPNYSGNPNAIAKGEVLNCRSIGGKPESYLVKIRFFDEPSYISDLSGYLELLTEGPRSHHGSL
ncbi:MAG: hypothetical protein R3B45_11545 [Bdellovibrionota bacterium]